MSTQPTHVSRYQMAQVKEIANRTLRALDEQNTVDHLLEHVDNGLLTEAEAWRLVSGRQFVAQHNLFRGAWL